MVLAFVRAAGAEDPEAVVNDVFLGVFGRLSGFAGDESGFRALLLTVARRRVVDDVRRRARRVPTRPWDDEVDRRTSPSVEEMLVGPAGDDRSPLTLVGSLPADQRDVVLLRLVADLSIAEVATILDKRPGAVKSLQRRALDSLRRQLASGPIADLTPTPTATPPGAPS